MGSLDSEIVIELQDRKGGRQDAFRVNKSICGHKEGHGQGQLIVRLGPGDK